MNNKSLRALCLSFPGVTEEVKWRQDSCFSIANELFCFNDIEADSGASFKVREEELEALISTEGIIPAPYMDRDQWVLVLDFSRLNDLEWAHYIRQSYELVKAALPENIRKNL